MFPSALNVCNNSLSVQDFLSEENSYVPVLTKDDFFDLVRVFAFIENNYLRLDESSAASIASDLLSEQTPCRLHELSKFMKLYRELTTTLCSSSSYAEPLSKLSGSSAAFYFEIYNKVLLRSSTIGVCDRELSLKKAYEYLLQKNRVPEFLWQYSKIVLNGIEDLNPLEEGLVRYLMGKNIKFERRKQRFNSTEVADGEILIDEKLKVNTFVAKDVFQEARWVASKVASLRLKNDKSRIALVFRSLDDRSVFFRDALRLNGLVFKDFLKRSLADTKAGHLLLSVIEAVKDRFPKDIVVEILEDTSFIGTNDKVKQLDLLLERVGILDDYEDMNNPTGAYILRLNRLLQNTDNEDESSNIRRSIDSVQTLLDIRKLVQEKTSLKRHIEDVMQVLKLNIKEDSEGFKEVQQILSKALEYICSDKQTVKCFDFLRWLTRRLESAPYEASRMQEYPQVEFLTSKSSRGRRFDYVFLVDMVHGKIPIDLESSILLSDEERTRVNEIYREPILRTRYGLPKAYCNKQVTYEADELSLFVGSFQTASEGLFLTVSKTDEKGKEQAQSEYFSAMEFSVSKSKVEENGQSNIANKNRIECQYEQAKDWIKNQNNHQLDSRQVERLLFFKKIRQQRDKFFINFEDSSNLEKTTGEFSFKANRGLFRNLFGSYLGISKTEPISGSLVESFAVCRYKAFLENMLGIRVFKSSSGDMDMRLLGQLAHKVLENFYRSCLAVRSGKFGTNERAILEQIFNKHVVKYLQKDLLGNANVSNAYVKWLKNALTRLVSNLTHKPPVEDVVPVAFEQAIGLAKQGKDKAGIPVKVGKETLYWAGIIDRVDESKFTRVIVDYKLSNNASIKRRLAPSEIMTSHFQIPLYLRLLNEITPSDSDQSWGGYLVSITDGTASPVIGLDKQKNLKRLILDEEEPEGLHSALLDLLFPYLNGAFPADVGEQCSYCAFARVCRVNSVNEENV